MANREVIKFLLTYDLDLDLESCVEVGAGRFVLA